MRGWKPRPPATGEGEGKAPHMSFPVMQVLRLILVALLVTGSLTLLGEAAAHPEDDFCEAGGSIDRQLCQQLADMNSSTAPVAQPLLDEDGNVRSWFGSGAYFLKIGVQHILPGGTDHILFVLALFLASQNIRSLITQISVFTVAHTVTLGLTAAGVISLPDRIVEPLIAASIAFVAIENLWTNEASRWRLFVIFGFGLFHGMGFARFVREIGLPPEQFWPSLIGFNIGVEIGQLSVVAVAFVAGLGVKRALALAQAPYTYRQVAVIPLSVIIAAIGLWWALTRSLGL